MQETTVDGLFALLAVVITWALARGGHRYRRRIALQEDVGIWAKLPPGDVKDRMFCRVAAEVEKYVLDHQLDEESTKSARARRTGFRVVEGVGVLGLGGATAVAFGPVPGISLAVVMALFAGWHEDHRVRARHASGHARAGWHDAL